MLWWWGKERGKKAEVKSMEMAQKGGEGYAGKTRPGGKVTEARRLVDEHQEATRDGGSGRYATCIKERVPRAEEFSAWSAARQIEA